MWGESVHYDDTVEWAKNAGLSDSAAEIIAGFNHGTDLGKKSGKRLKENAKKYHFNMNEKGKKDSRIKLSNSKLDSAAECYSLAKECKKFGNDDLAIFLMLSSYKYLGEGLHALQDVDAHGNISTGWIGSSIPVLKQHKHFNKSGKELSKNRLDKLK